MPPYWSPEPTPASAKRSPANSPSPTSSTPSTSPVEIRQRRTAARADLEQATGKSIFTTVPLDTSDLGSVRTAIDSIDTPLQTVVMNAGGTGGSTPLKLTKDGVTSVFASNVLGHVGASRAADRQRCGDGIGRPGRQRGSAWCAEAPAPPAHIRRAFGRRVRKRHRRVVLRGSTKVDDGRAYGQVKYLGALWMSELARRNPHLRLVTVSPGNTAGTGVFRDLGTMVTPLMNRILMPYVLPRFGLAHPRGCGRPATGRRFGAKTTSSSGRFYASAANTLTGPLIDQATIMADFADPDIQRHAFDAVHRFIPAR